MQVESPEKSFYVGCARNSDLMQWIDSVDKAIHASRAVKGLGADYERGIKFSPMWDADTPQCMECNRGFTIVVRRHHCRNCGKCVCGSCCFEKVRLDHIDEHRLQRVCNKCAEEIKGSRMKSYGSGGGYGAGTWGT